MLILQGAFIADDVTGLTIPRSWDFGHHDESLILALLVVAVPAAIVAAGRARVNRWALAGLGLFALVATVVLGETQREDYLDNRYEVAVALPLETGFRSTPEWKPIQEFGKDTRGARIAVVGHRPSASTSSTATTSRITCSTSARSCAAAPSGRSRTARSCAV